MLPPSFFLFFFFNDTATTEIYTLSLHDALPILLLSKLCVIAREVSMFTKRGFIVLLAVLLMHGSARGLSAQDRKSTRLNSSHGYISYAVFCLKKKKQKKDK